MSFTDFGLAKGLSVTPDWNGMVKQENDQFDRQNAAMQQKKAEVEKNAADMELGQTFDAYNQGRYNTFMKDKYKEIADFDMKNPGYEYSPEKYAQRKAIMYSIKNNPILQESANTKSEVEKLYKFVAENPGSENLVQDQLAEVTKTLESGNSIGGTSQGYRFRMPQVKDVRSEINAILPAISTKDIKYDKRSMYTETRLDEGALKSNVDMYFLNPSNTALMTNEFAKLSPDQQAIFGGSPKMMMMNMLKGAFVPEKSNPTQLHQTTGGSSTTKPTITIINPYRSDILNGAHISNNPQVRAMAISTIRSDGKINKQYVGTTDGKRRTTFNYALPNGNIGTMNIPNEVEIIDGDNYIPGTKGGVSYVKGTARWIDQSSSDANARLYAGYGARSKIIYNDKNEQIGIEYTMPDALFASHNNEAAYNQNVQKIDPTGMPQGIMDTRTESTLPSGKKVYQAADGSYWDSPTGGTQQ